MRSLSVLVCDDRPACLRELVQRLRGTRGLVLVDTPVSGDEPVLQLRRLQPRLVVVGVTSGNLAPFAVLRRQAEAARFLAVVEHDGLEASARAAGADAVLAEARLGAGLDETLRRLLGRDWPGLES